MRTLCALGLVLLGISLPCALSAQELSSPEDVAGRWEALDGKGGEVGMNILVTTTIASPTTNLVSVIQKLQSFEIGLYQRSGTDVTLLGYNFFTTSSTGGASWDGQRLRINLQQRAELPEVHVDLVWNGADRGWTGNFQRATFKKESITLKRPIGPQNSMFVGTWFESTGVMNNCLHMAQAQDGTLTGWADDLQMPDRLGHANGLRPPERAVEHYGEIAKVSASGPARIEVELRAYSFLCCSHRFAATLSSDGSSLIGEWPAGPNQTPRPARWVRVQGNSCRPIASQY